MSDRPNPQPPRRSGAAQQTGSGNEADASGKQPPVRHLNSLRSLERLREKVDAASQELKRLKEENAALSARIADLESRSTYAREGTLLSFDDDPEELRRKVAGFIEAIDRYLDSEKKS